MLNRLMAGRWISGASSLGLAAGLILGCSGLAFADGGHGGGHAGGGHAGGGHAGGGHAGGGHVGGGSMGSSHHMGSVGGVHHNGGSTHHYGGYGGYSGMGIYGLGGYGLGGYGLGGYGLGYSGFGNYGSPYGSGYGSGVGYSNYYSARPSTYYAPTYSPNYVMPHYPVLRPSQYTVMPSSTVASRMVSPQTSSNVYSGPVSAEGQPTGDLRPGMVLPDGAIVVSIGSSTK